MYYNWRDVQAQLFAMGFDPKGIDGMAGPNTKRALAEALESINGKSVQDLFDPSGLHSVIWHWTAGAEGIIELERKHYNAVVDGDGNVHDGLYRPEAQATYAVGRAASHTLNANTHRAGISADAMAGAVERPFKWGSNPLTDAHIVGLLSETAVWCKRFNIIPSRATTLTHAEVQTTLNIKQRFKWDYLVLPGMKEPKDAIWVGDKMREMLQDYM